MFLVNGQMVNHAGQPVDEQGKVLVAEQPSGAATLESVQVELTQAQARIAELEAQLAAQGEAGDPSSSDTRTNAELKAALDAKGVQYDARLNKAGLQALAAEHGA